MSDAVVEPMASGTEPTEAGWYATCWKGSSQTGVVEVRMLGSRLVVNLAGAQTWHPLGSFVFLARIYPDQISPA